MHFRRMSGFIVAFAMVTLLIVPFQTVYGAAPQLYSVQIIDDVIRAGTEATIAYGYVCDTAEGEVDVEWRYTDSQTPYDAGTVWQTISDVNGKSFTPGEDLVGKYISASLTIKNADGETSQTVITPPRLVNKPDMLAENIALASNGTVASNSYSFGQGNLAIDDSESTYWQSRSGGGDTPALTLDFGEPKRISSVQIIPRTPTSNVELRSFSIVASNDPDFENGVVTLCSQGVTPYMYISGKTAIYMPYIRDVITDQKFQYVRLKKDPTTYEQFTAAEFRVLTFNTDTAPAIFEDKPGIDGEPIIGNVLSGTYTFCDEDIDDAEGATEYKWYISDTLNGEYRAIEGQNEKKYAVQKSDLYKYIKFEVTPADSRGRVGTAYLSDPVQMFDKVSVTPEQSAVALAAFNDATAETVGNYFVYYTQELPIFGWDLSTMEYMAVKQYVEQYFVDLRISEYGTFTELGQIISAFDKAYLYAWINNATAGDGKRISDILNNDLKDDFNEDFHTDFAKVQTNYADVFVAYRDTFAESAFPNLTSLKSGITNAVPLALINSSSIGKVALTDVLTKYADVFGIKIDDYKDLDKTLVNEKIMEKRIFSKPSEVADAFYLAINETEKENSDKPDTTSKPKGSGGGGSGGIYGSVASTPQTVAVPDVQDGETVESDEVFNDLSSVPWAVESIKALAKLNVVNGDGAGHFNPNSFVTREEFVKMIVLALDFSPVAIDLEFDDVAATDWFYHFCGAAYSAGIVDGIDSKHFGVGEQITRQDMATIIFRAVNALQLELPHVEDSYPFDDADEIANYATEGITALQGAGIISGTGNGKFSPLDSATRAQAAKIIYGIVSLKH